MTDIQALDNIDIHPNGAINDYKYSLNGQALAFCDSEGYVHIYQKNKDRMVKKCDFKADEGAILSLSWADPKYGNIIGLGTYSNKVKVYQEQLQGWKEIAFNQIHEASVNSVQWSPCSLKLYGGSSDGKVSILELVHKTWKINSFSTGQTAITSLALQPLPLGEIISPQNNDSFYPRIAIAKKDLKVQVYCHKSEIFYNEQSKESNLQELYKQTNACGYSLLQEHTTQKQSIRSMIWRPSWGSINDSLMIVQLIYCSQEGSLKNIELLPNGECKTVTISQGQTPFSIISQSMTGNLICTSMIFKNKHESWVYEQIDNNQWNCINRPIN